MYCVIQISYEIGNLDEESQISAFYQLLLTEVNKDSSTR